MLILDGGLGAELDKRLEPRENNIAWCSRCHETHAAEVERVHRDFVKSGAQIVTANTYAALQYLTPHRSRAEIKRSVKRAVDVARAANAELVAGSLSAHRSKCFAHARVVESVRLLAEALGEARVDCVIVEMLQIARTSRVMVQASCLLQVPVMLGFAVRRDGATLRFHNDDTEFEPGVVREILSLNRRVACVGIMHTPMEVIRDAMRVVCDAWSGPLMAYPDCGVFTNFRWVNDVNCDADVARQMVRLAAEFPRLRIAGGCCGFGPKFIQLLRDSFPYCPVAALREWSGTTALKGEGKSCSGDTV